MIRRVIEYDTSTEVIIPDECLSLTIECWGGGGPGAGINGAIGTRAGGAGGQYSIRTIDATSVIGATLFITVASHVVGIEGDAGNGNDSYVYIGFLEVCRAKGGAGAVGNTPGLGSVTGGVGDTVYKGGDGDVGLASNYGGGGGGGAGRLGDGENANTYQPGTYYNYGGTGALSQGNGLTGFIAGGGGGGSLCISSGTTLGGSGAAGMVIITYVINKGNLLYMFE
jgi:hypothetical protein